MKPKHINGIRKHSLYKYCHIKLYCYNLSKTLHGWLLFTILFIFYSDMCTIEVQKQYNISIYTQFTRGLICHFKLHYWTKCVVVHTTTVQIHFHLNMQTFNKSIKSLKNWDDAMRCISCLIYICSSHLLPPGSRILLRVLHSFAPSVKRTNNSHEISGWTAVCRTLATEGIGWSMNSILKLLKMFVDTG